MSTLNGTSTLADVQAAYDNAASYAEDRDAVKALAFLTAARILLRRMPSESGTSTAHAKFGMELIQKEITACQDWLQANPAPGVGPTGYPPGGPNVIRTAFNRFRD